MTPSSIVIGKTLLIAEPRSNTLLVAGPPEHVDRIEEVIREMDKRPWQVSIACVVAEITLGDDLEYGIDVLRKAENIVVDGENVNWAAAFRPLTSGSGIIDPNLLTTVQGFEDAGATTNGLNVYASIGEFLNVYVRALENTGRAKVLARPFIFTANNKPAEIAIGERVPVPASSQSSVVTGNTTTFNTQIEYEDVNLVIAVTPLINSKDEVTLTISQINDDILDFVDVGGQQAPRISQQSLDTEVAIPNGGIAVIGGLIRDKENVNHNSLPVIARIPILRHIFGSTADNRSRRELLILIQPRIVETSDELTASHADAVRRTVIGKEAENFGRPPYNMSDVVLPAESGDVPIEQAHSLLPPVEQTGPATTGEQGKDPAPPNENIHADQLPAEKERRPSFWEKPPQETKKTSQKGGLKKLLPWNWGKD